MEKRVVRKEDGRYLIFYAFDRPVPRMVEQTVAAAGAGEPAGAGPAAAQAGGPTAPAAGPATGPSAKPSGNPDDDGGNG